MLRTALAFLILCVRLPAGEVFAETLRFGSVEADPQAEYIDLGDGQISDWEAFYAFLDGFDGLKKVDLFSTELRPDRIRELTARYPEISFGMTMRIQDHVLRTDATAFSTLHHPGDVHHGDSELSLVRYCRQLYALDLGHNRLSDLSFLEDLPELRVLILAMNTVTDITPVGKLRHLEYLEIFNNRISDVSCLAGLPYLTDLNLAGNAIADPAPIMKMTSLKRLWMSFYDTRLPAGEVRRTAEKIRAVLPECEVDSDSAGVGGTWREHPRYEVIRRIFSTGVYEPFADSPMENRP